MATGELEDNLYVSLVRLFAGFAAGAVLGVLFGVCIALSDTAERYTAPLFQFLRQLPTVALIPMFILDLRGGRELQDIHRDKGELLRGGVGSP